ncbi:Prostaglandin E synthase 2 [Linum perenne]
MRRVHVLANLARGIAAGGSGSPVAVVMPKLLARSALLSTSAASSPKCRPLKFADHFLLSATSVAAGVVFFSVAASQEAHAKELLKSIPKDVVLYQYEACPFCNKVKAFLDYYSIPYKVVEVNPISKKEIKWSDYKKVPILTVDGEQLVDSSGYRLLANYPKGLMQKAPVQKLRKKPSGESMIMLIFTELQMVLIVEFAFLLFLHHLLLLVCSATDHAKLLLFRWVDGHLVHVLSPNIYRNASEALESFDYITSNGNFSFTEKLVAKYAGATAMYFVSKKLKKKYNITDERAALYEAADTWVDALKGRDYLGGSRPNLADLAVFGVLRPIRYLKSGKDMVEHTHIGEWYSRMEVAVGEPTRVSA